MRFLLVLLLAYLSSVSAAERVTDFHSNIRIERNGTLIVTERFTVQAEGEQIKRGILRDFPTEYRDRLDNLVKVPFAVVSVLRNGASEPWVTERLANGVRIRIGSANVFLPRGPHTYEITYRTARQVGFFQEHDELYWNVNGNGWTLPFDLITAEVHLPQAIASSLLKAEAYTGPQGARGRSYTSFVRDGGAAFRSTRPFMAREGMTVVVAFPKGVVEQPTRWQRTRWFLGDNKGVLAGLLGALAVFFFLWWRWTLVGRDPRAGPRFPRYDPPAGLGPGGVRYVHKMGYHATCFSSTLLGLGERGALKIRKGLDSYDVRRTGTPAQWLPGEKAIIDNLLPHPDASVVIGKTHDPTVQASVAALKSALGLHFGEKLFSKNHGSIVVGSILGLASFGAMLHYDASTSALVTLGGLMLLTILLFRRWMPAYSVEGRRIQDHVEGLRQYLSIAEADELRRIKAPPQTKEEFARLLPYAVALDVESAWAKRFTAILGLAAVAAAASSYYSSDTGFSNSGSASLGESIGGIAETVTAAATPPGSSSGSSSGGGSSDSGGGGSSGGGGGGGGGSGW